MGAGLEDGAGGLTQRGKKKDPVYCFPPANINTS